MKIKLYSVIENVSKQGKKYWKVKLQCSDQSKISFIVDVNEQNYQALFAMYEKEVEVADDMMPPITAKGVYEGNDYTTRMLKGKAINLFVAHAYNVEFTFQEMLESFFSIVKETGVSKPTLNVVGEPPVADSFEMEVK